MRALALAILIGLSFAVIQVFVLPPDGFMSGDQGSKYLQTRAFAEQGPLDPAIDVESRDIDRTYAYQEPKLKYRRGQLVSEFMWLMPLLGAPFVAVLGLRGLYVVPALSALVVFFCAARLARRPDDPDGAITGLIVLLVTPVALYGLELWEHAPAAACVAIAAVLLVPPDDDRADGSSLHDGRAQGQRAGLPRGRFFAAGVAAIAGYLFREEAAVALPALLVGRALARDRDRLPDLIVVALWSGLGALTALIASTPMNLMMYGAALPLHLTQDAWEYAKSMSYLQVRRDIVTMLFMPARYAVPYAIALMAGVIGSISATRGRTQSRVALGVVHAAVGVMLGIAVVLPLWSLASGAAQGEAYAVDSAAHTWAFVPALMYLPWLGSPKRTPHARYLIVSAVLAVLFTGLVVPSTAGAQWSPRFFLQIAPLLAIPAAEATWGARPLASEGGHRTAVWMARAALMASFVMLTLGIGYLADAKTRFARVTHGLARLTAPGEIVITDVFWLPEVAATLAPTRRLLFTWNLADAPQIAALGVKAGFDRFTLVTYPLLTHHVSPDAVDVPGGRCLFVRGEHQYGLEIRGMVLSRYSCAQ